MRNERIKNVIIIVLILVVLGLSITNHHNYKEKENYESVISRYESTIEDDILRYAFFAGEYSTIVEFYYEGQMVSDTYYNEMKNMIEDFLEEPTYHKAYSILEKARVILDDSLNVLLDKI